MLHKNWFLDKLVFLVSPLLSRLESGQWLGIDLICFIQFSFRYASISSISTAEWSLGGLCIDLYVCVCDLVPFSFSQCLFPGQSMCGLRTALPQWGFKKAGPSWCKHPRTSFPSWTRLQRTTWHSRLKGQRSRRRLGMEVDEEDSREEDVEEGGGTGGTSFTISLSQL